MPLDLNSLSLRKLPDLCRRHGVRRLAIFGSALRDDFSSQSDIDVLVEFEPEIRVGLSFFTLQDELSVMLGRKVDLNTPGFLGQHFREKILVEAHELYVAA